MPKLKTHKATSKRFKLTSRKKLRRLKRRRAHARRNQSKRARRASGKYVPTSQVDAKRIRRLLGLPQSKS